jgi:hypothetical protein
VEATANAIARMFFFIFFSLSLAGFSCPLQFHLAAEARKHRFPEQANAPPQLACIAINLPSSVCFPPPPCHTEIEDVA